MHQFSGCRRAACVFGTLAAALTLCVVSAWASEFGAGISGNAKFSSGTLQLEGTVGANNCYSTGTGSGGSVSANSSACSTGSPVPSGTLSSTASSSATTTLKSVGTDNATTAALASTSCGVAQLADSASATDWSGTGPDTALIYKGVTYGATGPFTSSTAATFDGSTGWAETTTSYSNPETFTELAWFKTTTPGVISVFSNSENPVVGGETANDRILFVDSNGDLEWGVHPGSNVYEIESASVVDTGNWVFAAASVGPAGMTMYVNGALVASNAGVTSAEAYGPGWWTLGYSNDTGWFDPNPAAGYYFNGSLAQVAIIPSQLTAAQITALHSDAALASYSAAVTALSPASYWQMNDTGAVPYEGTVPGGTASTSLQDASGNGNTATAVGGVTLGASGPATISPSDGITLDGSTGYGETTTQYASPGPQTFSLSAWFETTVASGSIIGYDSTQSTGAATYWDRMLWMDPTGHVVLGLTPLTGQFELKSPSTYNNGAWHQVTTTVTPTSATTATVLMYVDGALVAGTTNDETITSSEPAYPNAGWWHLGWSHAVSGWADPPTTAFWNGSLSEMTYFPTVLTSAIVSTLYDVGSVAAFDQDVATLTPTAYWPLQDSASNICGTTDVTVQTTVGGTNTCIYPAQAGACPANSATYLEPGLGERSITAPTSTTPVSVLVTMKLRAAETADLAGLHELIDLNFGTALAGTQWWTQIAYPAAWSQL